MIKGLRKESEFEGYYIPTNNQMGFMLTKIDPLVQRFIDYAANDSGNWHLDVGAAFGIATIAALEQGAKIVANDLDETHLKIIKELGHKRFRDRLQLCVGDIKDEVTYPPRYFGSILYSRVLHFFSGEEIIKSLKNAREWLINSGKIFLVNETPYFGTCKSFLPVYLKRKQQNNDWPGYLEAAEAKRFFDSSKRPFVTSSVHFFDEDLIRNVAQEANLCIDDLGTLDRAGYFPDDALFDGKESIWAVLSRKD